MKSIVVFIFMLFVSVCFLNKANAAPAFEILTSHLPPYSIENGTRKGFMVEIIEAVEQHMGRNAKIRFLPWTRAQWRAQTEENKVIFPLTRIEEREDKYSWLFDLAKIELVFVTKGGKTLSLEEARKLDWITVQQATPFESYLKEKGFKNIIPSPLSSRNHVKLLASGRVDAWFTAKNLALENLKTYQIDDFVISPPAVVYRVYIAASKYFDPDKADAYRRSYNALLENGTLTRIMQKYGYQDPPRPSM